MGDVSEIQQIVELLKGPPFHRNDSLVSFSSKSPIELLQILNDIFAQLDQRQAKDIRDEDQSAMAARMLEFLVVLGYKVEGDMFVCTLHLKHSRIVVRSYSFYVMLC